MGSETSSQTWVQRGADRPPAERLAASGPARLIARRAGRRSRNQQQAVLEVADRGSEAFEALPALPCGARDCASAAPIPAALPSRFASRSAEERKTRQVARPDPEARQFVGGADDLAVGLVVDGLAFRRVSGLGRSPKFSSSAISSSAGRRFSSMISSRVRVGARGGRTQDRPCARRRRPAPYGLPHRAHQIAAGGEAPGGSTPQRQELVALQAQDRPQPVRPSDWLVEAVTAGGAPAGP